MVYLTLIFRVVKPIFSFVKIMVVTKKKDAHPLILSQIHSNLNLQYLRCLFHKFIVPFHKIMSFKFC